MRSRARFAEKYVGHFNVMGINIVWDREKVFGYANPIRSLRRLFGT